MVNKKLRIAVFMGGPSAEHEVSLSSGKKILPALDRKKYDVLEVVIGRGGTWPFKKGELKKRADIALIAAMHGEYGEDGTLQKELEKLKVSYTGSGPKASQLGMDKVVAAERFRAARLRVPEFMEVHTPVKAENPFGYPVVVKPADRGSSVGVYIVQQARELTPALTKAFAVSKRVLIQRYIKGRELTCGVLEIKGKLKALPVTEIVPKAAFFDYGAKYTAGGSQEITPAAVPKKITQLTQAAALAAHRALGCRGYSRTDFILTPRNELFTLEINTLPGMTATSLVPQAAAVMGISFSKLLDLIISAAK